MRLLMFILYVIIAVAGLLTMVRGNMDGKRTYKNIGQVMLSICIVAGVIALSIAVL